MDILVRKKPFRDEKQGGFMNDIDSDAEKNDKKDSAYTRKAEEASARTTAIFKTISKEIPR